MDHDFKYETIKKRQGLKKQMFNYKCFINSVNIYNTDIN